MTIYESTYPPSFQPKQGLFQYLQQRPINPDLVAFTDSTTGRSYTRAQTFSTAKRLAKGLKTKKGLQKGDVVVIFAKNTVDYPVVLLACIAAGLVPSLASAAYTPPELAYQIEHSRASLVFVDPSLLPVAHAAYKLLYPTARSRLGIEAVGGKEWSTVMITPGLMFEKGHSQGFETLLSEDEGFEEVPSLGELDSATALMCYSSGTTGLPKGVELVHSNLTSVVNQLEAACPPIKAGKDSCIGFLPMYHIYGCVKLIFWALHLGAKVIFIPQFSVENFCRVTEQYKTTFSLAAPPVLMALSKSPVVANYNMSSMKWIMTGAAPCGVELTLLFEERFKKSGTLVVQGYGSTETAPATCILNLNDCQAHRGTVGKLVPNMQARLVDENEQDVPVGESGELWVRGPNIMKGYLRNEIATKNAKTSEGWYKTGDVCTISPEGIYRIVDRRKELIKYKGLQVAPAELEAVLLDHPEIADAGVIGHWSEEQQTELPRAYILPSKGVKHYDSPEKHQAFVTHLHDWLKPKVAHYKQLVGGIVLIPEMPRLPSGKIIRRQLKERAKEELNGVKEGPAKAKL